MKQDNKIPVVITTDNTKRGVFFGYINPNDVHKDPLTVELVQMAVYWSAEMHGVIGLAAIGPDKDCRITPAAPKGEIKGISLVLEATEEAAKNWKKEPWGK